MQAASIIRRRGFTLLETVIAIGVLAVLLTGFILVFAPAAAGIKKAIDVQEADRLASTLERELVTLRDGQNYSTGFDKAFKWIEESDSANDALLVYQYRGKLTSVRADGTPEPEPLVKGKVPGKDYIVQTMVRRKSDSDFLKDIEGLEGAVYLVKCTQLVFNKGSGQLETGTPGTIKDPKGDGGSFSDSDQFPEAVIAFTADFYTLPGRNKGFFSSSAYTDAYNRSTNPVFSRNLAVRR